MKLRFALSTILFLSLFVSTSHAKSIDPYKVLGVKKDASQREIQKAFHKLSLQYHPDKNKDKGAQAKFEEINNAYEILSDEEKRKNYDLYGDERGNQGFDAGYPGQDSGYTYYTSGGQTPNGFNFRPGGWQNMGGQGGSQSFSFSFGGPSASSFGFGGLDDIFDNMFGGNKAGGGFQGFGGSSKSRAKPQSGPRSSSKSIRAVTSQVFKKEIVDAGMTWLLLSRKSDLLANEYFQSTLQEVADSLQGAIKVGMVDCTAETSFCREVGILPKKNPRVFVYSYKNGGKGSLVEYGGDLVAKDVKTFCQDHLPRFSERIEPRHIDSLFGKEGKLPRVLLLSTKKDTPVIWRVISGLYHRRITFNDVQAYDLNDPMMKHLGVDGLPALVGWLSNGEKRVLKTGISVKDLKSAIQDLSKLLDDFEKQNKKVAAHAGKPESASEDRMVPLLSASNFGDVCSETNPVCIIGAFRSSKAREKLESILFMVSQKSLSRRRSSVSGSRESISYSLVDGARQAAFLSALDKSGFKSSDKLLIAYKPRRGKFAAFEGEMTAEEVERFIGAVLNGDIQFKKVRQKPVVK